MRWSPPDADDTREFRFGLPGGGRENQLGRVLDTWMLVEPVGEAPEALPSAEVMESEGTPIRGRVARPRVLLRLLSLGLVAACVGVVLGLPEQPTLFAHFAGALMLLKTLEIASELRFVFGKDRPT